MTKEQPAKTDAQRYRDELFETSETIDAGIVEAKNVNDHFMLTTIPDIDYCQGALVTFANMRQAALIGRDISKDYIAALSHVAASITYEMEEVGEYSLGAICILHEAIASLTASGSISSDLRKVVIRRIEELLKSGRKVVSMIDGL